MSKKVMFILSIILFMLSILTLFINIEDLIKEEEVIKQEITEVNI